jgi:hypothetical protein
MGSAAVVGFLRGPLAIPARALYLIIGIMLLFPVDLFTGAGYVNLLGVLLAAAAIAYEFFRVPTRPKLAA